MTRQTIMPRPRFRVGLLPVIWCLSVGVLLISGCARVQESSRTSDRPDRAPASPVFSEDVAFLRRFTEIIVLREPSGGGRVAISPALQGRVMTSAAAGDEGLSFGWINRDAFLSGDTSAHMNAFGGEDRFWLGPEGGQFSIYFSRGAPFDLDNWHVPRIIDLEPFALKSMSGTAAVFAKEASLTNYSGTVFRFSVERAIGLISKDDALTQLGFEKDADLSLVAYQSVNTLRNDGGEAWRKETGLLSVWILGMYNPSPNTTVIIPHAGQSSGEKPIVNDDYFGAVPGDRLKVDDRVVYFRADGEYRSKIGLAAGVATQWLGSYDADHGVLTLVRYNKPDELREYVNSAWEIQQDPYGGDVINAYNDGAPAPGVKPLGPFYELESSSPAAALAPGDTITHIHTTYHLQGNAAQLGPVMQKVLGVTPAQVMNAFKE